MSMRPELLRGAEALGCTLDEAQADRLLKPYQR